MRALFILVLFTGCVTGPAEKYPRHTHDSIQKQFQKINERLEELDDWTTDNHFNISLLERSRKHDRSRDSILYDHTIDMNVRILKLEDNVEELNRFIPLSLKRLETSCYHCGAIHER